MFTMSMDPFIFYENQIKKLTNEYENEIENLKEEQFYASKREFEENSRLNVSINGSFTGNSKIQDLFFLTS